MNKLPSRGDKVLNNNRVLSREGTIISGIFRDGKNNEEIIDDCFIRYTRTQHGWISAEEIIPCWDEERKMYVVGVE